MTREQYEERVRRVLKDEGYKPTLKSKSVELILAHWCDLEEFQPDPTDGEIVKMYEVLSYT